MKEKRGIAIENSFTLKLENTTNAINRVSLFEQGGVGLNQAREVNAGKEVAFGGNLVLPNLIWSVASSQPFYYSGGANITAPFDVNLWQNQTTGNLVISTVSASSVSVPLVQGETISQVNARIKSTIETTATTSNFKSPSGKFTQIRIFFDENYFNQFLSLLPFSQTETYSRNAWGVSVEYPTDSVEIWKDVD